MRYPRTIVVVAIVLTVGLGSAWAQIAVFDAATSGRNATIAALRQHIVELATAQRDRLQAMARRLSDDVDTQRYAPSDPPHSIDSGATLYADPYRAALATGDLDGRGFAAVAQERRNADDAFAALPPAALGALHEQLATLDAADSSILAATHQAGALRANSAHEAMAINRLEADVTRRRSDLGATAATEAISGAALIGATQRQARLQYLTAIVEQMLIDNKRARDAEAAALNMQLRRLEVGGGEGTAGLLTGAGDDLRTWRQP